jgi:pyruvate/2-oxoglutarate dehydrogenase complex dihydrolipoamide dehydrogenase (E3) component
LSRTVEIMTTKDFDVIVLGLGPGGEDVGEALAAEGWSVLGVEPRLIGGECPYFGCIPSKMMVRGAELLAEARRVDGVSGTASVHPDFTPVHARIRDEATDDWNDQVAVDRFEKSGATFVRGAGRIAGRDDDGTYRVVVGEQSYRSPRVILATGTAPAMPPIEGLADLDNSQDGPIWTNRQAVRADAAPESLVVIGGGAIGCELAQAFARFGTKVSVIEGAPRILSVEEPEASEVVAAVFEREGITVHEGVGVTKVGLGGDGVEVTLKDGTVFTGEKVLVSAGRKPNLAEIGLDTIGLDPKARSMDVDDHMAVRGVEGLFAIGDIAGHGQFTHVAVWQSRVLTAHLLGTEEPFGGYHGLAWATFTDPEVGHVGMTEAQARDAGVNVRIGVQQIASNSRGWIHGPGNDGLLKVVEDADRGVLVGATAISPYGGELLGMLTVAVHAAVPTKTLLSMHYAFPTLHRALLEALRALK